MRRRRGSTARCARSSRRATSRPKEPRPAAELLQRLARSLPADVYRWTGHFPEHTRALLAQLERRATELELVYAGGQEERVERAATVLVTALAMSHVQTGSYLR